MAKKRKKVKLHSERNLHACHPIMKKGGVHEKTRGAKRAAAKRKMKQDVSAFLGRSFLKDPLSLNILFKIRISNKHNLY